MYKLTAGDYRGVLEFVRDAGEVAGPDAFSEPLRVSLATLLRADTVWYSAVRVDVATSSSYTVRNGGVEIRWGCGAGAVANGLPPHVLEGLRQYAHEDPIPALPAIVNQPVRRSDVVSTQEWRKRGRWAHVDQPVGAEDWVRLWIGAPDAPIAVFEVDNCRAEWDDRVLAVLSLLAPHLLQFARRELRYPASGSPTTLTPRELEILELVADGRTNAELAHMLWISPNTVRKHLENAFDKLEVHTRTAAVARAFGGRSATEHGSGYPGSPAPRFDRASLDGPVLVDPDHDSA